MRPVAADRAADMYRFSTTTMTTLTLFYFFFLRYLWSRQLQQVVFLFFFYIFAKGKSWWTYSSSLPFRTLKPGRMTMMEEEEVVGCCLWLSGRDKTVRGTRRTNAHRRDPVSLDCPSAWWPQRAAWLFVQQWSLHWLTHRFYRTVPNVQYVCWLYEKKKESTNGKLYP